MNLAKLFETQRILDERILEQHSELKGQNNLEWKVLALQVELGECANEWRGFKKWSNDQEPRRWKHDDACLYCDGKGVLLDWGSMNFWECGVCKGTGEVENVGDPLLEEYVDCLHFILSIGLEMELTNTDISKRKQLTNRIVTRVFSDLMLAAGTLIYPESDKPHNFGTVLHGFIYLGEMLGFSWEQIEQAYYDKNVINHERQATGY